MITAPFHDVCKQRARACLFSLCKCTLASTDRKHMLRFESRRTLPPKTFQDFFPSCFLHRQSARSRLTKFYFLSKTYPLIRNSGIRLLFCFSIIKWFSFQFPKKKFLFKANDIHNSLDSSVN